MADPFIGEIRMTGFNFAPVGWALCDGQLLAISGNDALFALIGTTYGGDGQNSFALPDLRGRAPIHVGQGSGLTNRTIGERAGSETVTLTATQIAAHNHAANANTAVGTSTDPAGKFWAQRSGANQYLGTANSAMAPGALQNAGGSQPHENMPPSLVINFIICLVGIFPSQN
jgi:microcystin-dependent protein